MIERKLESPRQCIARLRARRSPTVEALAASAGLQGMRALDCIRAVQVCVDIGAHVPAPSGSAPPRAGRGLDLASQPGAARRAASGCGRRIGSGVSVVPREGELR